MRDDYTTADHPPCPVCDPSILPEGWDPIDSKAAVERPDGSRVHARGQVEVLLNGEAIRDVDFADPERGTVSQFHRALGPRILTAAQHARGETVPADEPPVMVRHFCQRGPGGRHVLPPGVEPHVCHVVTQGEVVVIDKVTGKPPVFVPAAASV